MFISILQTQLSHNLTTFDIKYYTLKFFEWEYENIFGENFDITNDTNKKLLNLIYFIKSKYSNSNTIYKIDSKDVTKEVNNNTLKLDYNVNKIEINNTNYKFKHYQDNTTGNFKFTKPDSKYLLPFERKPTPSFGKKRFKKFK
jgi:hypothetical protein